MPAVDPAFASELRSSGVSLAATYLGSVPVLESMSVMVGEMRTQVVSECIQHVAATVGICAPREINPIVSRIIGEVQPENYVVDINISSKMVKVIRNNRLIQRHPFTFFSFGSQGEKNGPTEKMFGYIAKNKDGNDRRCHVVSSKDVQVMIDILVAAINVSTMDAQPEGTIRRTNLSRQSFVSNCRSPNFDDVKGKTWYHGNLSREGAQALLSRPGDFLVRRSDNTPGKFVLSGMTAEGEHKHLLLLDSLNRVRTRDNQFNTISELVEYHMEYNTPVVSEAMGRITSMNLLHAVPPTSEPTDSSSAPSPQPSL